MKGFIWLLGATLAIAGPALAQQRTTDNPPAVANPKDVNKTTAAPVPGKNSFTEEQAKKRLEANGYGNITGLVKDENSIWRASATTAAGAQVKVSVDYQGNIKVE